MKFSYDKSEDCIVFTERPRLHLGGNKYALTLKDAIRMRKELDEAIHAKEVYEQGMIQKWKASEELL